MDRRRFLKLASATTVGLFAGPLLIFADKQKPVDLAKSISSALKAGRPLLVITIPKEAPYLHGESLGAYLNHASNADLALLAMTDLVCSPLRNVQALYHDANITDDTFLVILTPADAYSQATSLRALKSVEMEYEKDKPYEDMLKQADEAIVQRNAVISAFITKNLGGEKIKAFAEHARRSLPEKTLETITSEGSATSLTGQDLLAGAAILLESVVNRSAQNPSTVIRAISDSARQQFVKNPPPGAKWAHSPACGPTQIEGDEMIDPCPPCGMGQILEKEGRFLHFLTQDKPH